MLQFGGFIRSVVDADEHRMAERLLKQLQRDNPQARRICQKHFWSRDKTIKVQMSAGSSRPARQTTGSSFVAGNVK